MKAADIAIEPWRRPRRWPALAAGEVHLWAIYLDDGPGDGYAALLSADECARAAAFRRAADRRRFVVGRRLLRTVAGSHLGVAPADVHVLLGAHGKPAVVADRERIGVNLSHAGGCVVLAVVRDAEVGVDVEEAARAVAVNDVAHVLAAADVARILAAPEAERERLALRAWTRFEAGVKATGAGLGGGADAGAQQPLVEPPMRPGYLACVSVPAATRRVRCWDSPWLRMTGDRREPAAMTVEEDSMHAEGPAKDEHYKVVVNAEQQYSIWPAERAAPLGWAEDGTSGTRDECLEHIKTVWTDLRPLSLRLQGSDGSEPRGTTGEQD